MAREFSKPPVSLFVSLHSRSKAHRFYVQNYGRLPGRNVLRSRLLRTNVSGRTLYTSDERRLSRAYRHSNKSEAEHVVTEVRGIELPVRNFVSLLPRVCFDVGGLVRSKHNPEKKAPALKSPWVP